MLYNHQDDTNTLSLTVNAYLASSVMIKYIVDIFRQEYTVGVLFVDINPVNCHLL